jgi:hypothetical protein
MASERGKRMSKYVWKYPLEIKNGGQKIDTFAGSNIVHCDSQNGQLCLWIEVDPSNRPLTVIFHVIGTGHPIPPGTSWVGTAQQPPFVWHVYEERLQP